MPQNGAIRSLNYLFCYLETKFVVKPENTVHVLTYFFETSKVQKISRLQNVKKRIYVKLLMRTLFQVDSAKK